MSVFTTPPSPDDFLAYNVTGLRDLLAASAAWQAWLGPGTTQQQAADRVGLFWLDLTTTNPPWCLVSHAGMSGQSFAGGTRLEIAGGGRLWLLFRDTLAAPLDDAINTFAVRVSRVVNEVLEASAVEQNPPIKAIESDPEVPLTVVAESKSLASLRWIESAFYLSY